MFSTYFIATLALAAPSFSSDQSDPSAVEYQSLMSCVAVHSDAERLSCFDREASRLHSAEQSGEVIIMPRARVEQTRRALFGFSVPNIPDMMSGDSVLDSIETSLVSATRGDGWIFHLSDGSVWRQVDTTALNFSPREGMPVRIRRAAVGSFMLKVGNSPAVRARRQ